MRNERHKGYVIYLRERYVYMVRKGRIYTAYFLAGARIFTRREQAIEFAAESFKSNVKYQIIQINSENYENDKT